MIQVDEHHLDRITEAFFHLLRGRVPRPIPIPEDLPENEVRQLLTYVNRFLVEHAPFSEAMRRISEGDLDAPAPPGRTQIALSYKALQSNLRHLTWKTQRIAMGRLDERVDFMGVFSKCFNSMTEQLKDSFQAIEERNRIIEEEKERSERLLRNVLPAQVAEELKTRGRSPPQSFPAVSVFFSDLVGFTRRSAELDPSALIADLNEIYTRFDEIMDARGWERIKTIGDAYLAVCGMPEAHPDHAERMVEAAIEAMGFMEERRAGTSGWQVRMGIHSGPVVGGIVGVKKYIYDVFGDTINTAARMETTSEPMRINLSEATWLHVRGKIPCVEREPIVVKGKGPMRMFFVGDGRPGDRLPPAPGPGAG
ncbi:MAG: adenylate/guanylate cyclase domain-containing protein, partial [Planctomycetota bacterium]